MILFRHVYKNQKIKQKMPLREIINFNICVPCAHIDWSNTNRVIKYSRSKCSPTKFNGCQLNSLPSKLKSQQYRTNEIWQFFLKIAPHEITFFIKLFEETNLAWVYRNPLLAKMAFCFMWQFKRFMLAKNTFRKRSCKMRMFYNSEQFMRQV